MAYLKFSFVWNRRKKQKYYQHQQLHKSLDLDRFCFYLKVHSHFKYYVYSYNQFLKCRPPFKKRLNRKCSSAWRNVSGIHLLLFWHLKVCVLLDKTPSMWVGYWTRVLVFNFLGIWVRVVIWVVRKFRKIYCFKNARSSSFN